MKTICFTGHRPNKLYGYDLNNPKYKKLTNVIGQELLKIFNCFGKEERYHFITGGALGLDTLAFNIIDYAIKTLPYHITQELAIPFKDQPIRWLNQNDIVHYNNNMKLADKITYVDSLDRYSINNSQIGSYNPIKMQKRNEYMVDNSDIVIAIWSSMKKGGTWNCVNYAKKLNKRIIIINPNSLNIEYTE